MFRRFVLVALTLAFAASISETAPRNAAIGELFGTPT
jgi:hypothetical protein